MLRGNLARRGARLVGVAAGALMLALATPTAAADSIVVPGGAAAVARLLPGVDPAANRFAGSLNRVLLTDIQPEHAADRVHQRRQLIAYLDTVAVLRARFTFPLEVSGLYHRESLRAIAGELGYGLDGGDERPTLSPRGGEEAARRRQIARALDWNLVAIAEGRRTEPLRLDDQPVPSPLPLAEWRQLTGAAVSPSAALQQLASDQRLGLVLAARRRLSDETRAAISPKTWRWLYEDAAIRLYRLAPTLRVADGRWVLPGGEHATSVWPSVIGARPSAGDKFLRRLFASEKGKTARLWQALAWAPPAIAEHHVDALVAGGRRGRGLRLRGRRRRGRGGDGDGRAFQQRFGLASLIRALPAAAGAGAESVVDLAVRAAIDGSSLRRGGGRGGSSPLDRLVASHQGSGARRPLYRRTIRIAGSLRGRDALATTELAASLAATAEGRAPALAVLDALDLERAGSAVAYLAAVSHLAELPANDASEALIVSFQGGVELLRHLALARQIPHPSLEDALESWGRLHLGARDPVGASTAQLRWIAELVAALPEAAAAAPGRGPRERAVLQALAGGSGREQFRWNGLDYTGRRARRRAAAMTTQLELQSIPSADRLIERAGGTDRRLADDVRAFLTAPAYLVAIGDHDNPLFADHGLIRRHRLHSEAGGDNSWLTARVMAQHGGGEPYVLGHLSGITASLSEYHLRGRHGGVYGYPNRDGRWLEAQRSIAWSSVTPPLSRLVAGLVTAGRELREGARAELGGAAGERLAYVEARIPRARLERDASSAASLVSPSEDLALGLAAIAGDRLGDPGPELLSPALRRRIEETQAELGDDWRARLDVIGPVTPRLLGRFRPWVGTWPPYEAVEGEHPFDAIIERQTIDVVVAVVDFLGRHDLPGEVGGDLMAELLVDASAHRHENARDWEGHVRWINTTGDDFFAAGMERCLRDGRYSARLF